jgi:hypothetical protein
MRGVCDRGTRISDMIQDGRDVKGGRGRTTFEREERGEETKEGLFRRVGTVQIVYCSNLRVPMPPPILPSERRERVLVPGASETDALAACMFFADGFLPIFGLIFERSQGAPGDSRKKRGWEKPAYSAEVKVEPGKGDDSTAA